MGKYRKIKQVLLVLLATLSTLTQAVCPNGCKCNDDILLVDCEHANLDIVPITLNPSVRRLNLKSNKIRSLDTGFNFYHQLQVIDLSQNHLVKIMPNSFSAQTKLLHLKLNSNKISHISNQTFGTGLHSLVLLDLSQNLLENIEPGIFANTPSLEELDMGQNTIKVLNSSSFQGLGNLRTLKIDRNELIRVPDVFSKNSMVSTGTGSFMTRNYMPHLAELYLGTNPIRTLSNDGFSAANNLITLDLSGCKISTIEQYAFRGLDVLRSLRLSDNDLKIVPTVAFPPLAQLETLKLGRNPIEEFKANAFQGLRALKTFEMDGATHLQLIDKEAFSSNFDLEVMVITKGQKLAILPQKLFSQQSLRTLNLMNNVLTTLPENLVNWKGLRNLNLDGNSFHCVCELFWLRDLLLLEKFKNVSSMVTCAEPKELREQKLILVSDKDLNCYLNGPVQKTILGVSVALAIVLLVVFFWLLYRYHDRIKNTCKSCIRRPGNQRKNRTSSVISTEKERMPYPEEFATFLHPQAQSSVRSLQRQNPHPLHHNNGGHYGGHYNEYETPHVNLNMNYPRYPHYPSLHVSRDDGLSHHQHPSMYASPDHNLQMHFPHSAHQPLVKPIPITEL